MKKQMLNSNIENTGTVINILDNNCKANIQANVQPVDIRKTFLMSRILDNCIVEVKDPKKEKSDSYVNQFKREIAHIADLYIKGHSRTDISKMLMIPESSFYICWRNARTNIASEIQMQLQKLRNTNLTAYNRVAGGVIDRFNRESPANTKHLEFEDKKTKILAMYNIEPSIVLVNRRGNIGQEINLGRNQEDFIQLCIAGKNIDQISTYCGVEHELILRWMDQKIESSLYNLRLMKKELHHKMNALCIVEIKVQQNFSLRSIRRKANMNKMNKSKKALSETSYALLKQ